MKLNDPDDPLVMTAPRSPPSRTQEDDDAFRDVEEDNAEDPRSPDAATNAIMIIFGASGDLTRRKLMPALFNLDGDGLFNKGFSIVGFARTNNGEEAFRDEMREGVEQFSRRNPFPRSAWRQFASRLHYHVGNYDDPASFEALKHLLRDIGQATGARAHLYYFALPPNASEAVLRCMKETGLVDSFRDKADVRVMVEKPFGLDYEGARRLNRALEQIFDESQIHRIDHYLAKDTIRNLLVFRFANSIFEPVWNRAYIDNVQITAAERIGIEGRGGYYEESGVVRDMVQNHILQVMALTAMEPPLAGDVESVRDKTVEVFKSLAPVEPQDFVFGQYRGYRDERNVDRQSSVPTFVALKLSINNWRWEGVPFYIRSGKALGRKVTEVTIRFKDVPLSIFGNVSKIKEHPNTLVVRLQPDEGIRLSFLTKLPGREDAFGPAHMDFRYASMGLEMPEAYERIVVDGLHGRRALFWRADGIEAAWRVVEPLLALPKTGLELPVYDRGSWGPKEAGRLLQNDGRRWLSSY